MKIGLGIDTGGTCTDAVLFDFEENMVLATAKAITTKEDLSIGILNAIDSLPASYLPEIVRVALSTTLATNAVVENKGGRAKLLMMNAYRKVVSDAGKHYGLPPMEDIRFLDAELPEKQDTGTESVGSEESGLATESVGSEESGLATESVGSDEPGLAIESVGSDEPGSLNELPGEECIISVPNDWKVFFEENSDWVRDADAMGIVELDASLNGAILEKTAKAYLEATYAIPAIGGFELFSEPNVLQRGAGTLLNARLMPVIGDFLSSVKQALVQRGIQAPVVIVRSDGTLMSETFTGVRPVETLLCGPAASVMGGLSLSGAPDSLIVDMGGTTTDMAIVRNGVPLKAEDGIRIGKWKTYVKGVYIDTFGLGGDSAIRHTQHGQLHLDTSRIMPLSMLADKWPNVVGKLEKLLATKYRHTLPLHEFYVLVRDIGRQPDAASRYTEREIAFCDALRNGPLIWMEAAEAIGLDMYNLNMTRLEREGVVMRCGLTPTDLMHVRGEFTRYNREAAMLGLRFVAACTELEPTELVDRIYDRIKKTLYIHLVRLLLEETDPHYRKHGLGIGLERVIAAQWDAFSQKSVQRGKTEFQVRHDDSDTVPSEIPPANPLTEWQKVKSKKEVPPAFGLLDIDIRTPAVLVAIGAPTHIFLPDVARALGTTCMLPEHAGVANALGAVIAHISAEVRVEIRLEGGPGGFAGYRVRGFEGGRLIENRDEAVAFARADAEAQARAEALRRGAVGELTVTSGVVTQAAEARGGARIELGITVTATAVGGSDIVLHGMKAELDI